MAILNDLGFESVTTLLDGDKSHVSEQLAALFPSYTHFVLPADDIRDKPVQARAAKTGVCTDGGKLKEEFAEVMADLLSNISASAPAGQLRL